MASGDIAPGLIDPAALAPAPERRRISWVKTTGTGFAIAGMAIAGCTSESDAGAPVENGGGGQLSGSPFEDFRGIQPPDCSPDENGPSVIIEEQDDGLAISGVIRNASEYDANTDLYLGTTTSRPGEPGEGYRTRLEQGVESTIMIPDEEVEAMEMAGGRLTVHIVAMPEEYVLDTGSVSEGVVVQEIVHSAIKQGSGIEQPPDRDAADIINVLATVVSQCSSTRFENGKLIHIINTQEDYGIANPRPEGIDSGQGGSEQIPPQAPSPSPDAPEATHDPNAIYPDQILPIIQNLNQEQVSLGDNGIFSYTHYENQAGAVVGLGITVYMGGTGLTEEDESYQTELDTRCEDAKTIARDAGLPVEDLPVSCNGIY